MKKSGILTIKRHIGQFEKSSYDNICIIVCSIAGNNKLDYENYIKHDQTVTLVVNVAIDEILKKNEKDTHREKLGTIYN